MPTAPNAYERDYSDGFAQVANPALKGEHIDTLELVADHRARHDLNLRVSAYQWSMRDLVVLGIDPVSGLPQYQSGDRVKTKGLELSADKTWDWGGPPARQPFVAAPRHGTLHGRRNERLHLQAV